VGEQPNMLLPQRLEPSTIWEHLAQRWKCVGENSVVPPGLGSFVPLFPALPRWAKLVRPSGVEFSGISSHQLA